MNFLQLLFQPEDRDSVVSFLKQQFQANVSQVNVETLLDNQMLYVSWDGLLDPIQLATELTEQIPSVIIETNSITGIESTSRFFNKAQLW